MQSVENIFMKKFEKMYGSVQCFGVKIVIMQRPYIDLNHYQALGMDEDENEYMIKWSITNRYAEEDAEACDWEQYTVRRI